MRTEFQKPTWTPPQFRPVHAEYHAFAQAARLGADGRLKIEKARTSSEVLSEVAITTSSGMAKNRHVQARKAYKPKRPMRACAVIGSSATARSKDRERQWRARSRA